MPLHVSSTMWSSPWGQNCIIQLLVLSHNFDLLVMRTLCSKHVEAWNKLIVTQKCCASSWLITKINILRCTVSKTLKKKNCIVDLETDRIYTFWMRFLYSKIFKHGDVTTIMLWKRMLPRIMQKKRLTVNSGLRLAFRSSCDVMQRRIVVTDVLGQPIGPFFKGQAVHSTNLHFVTSQKSEYFK